MGVATFLILLAVVLFVLARASSNSRKVRAAPSVPVASSPKPRSTRSSKHQPARPSGTASAPRGPIVEQLEVAGEHYYLRAIVKLLDAELVASRGAEVEAEAILVPDPDNPFDDNAVAVWINGGHVGYLSADDASEYHAPIARVGTLVVEARVWARGKAPDLRARVTLAAPEPGGV